MRFLVSLCVPLLLLINDKCISGQWAVNVASNDPCDSYTVLDEPWRATSHRYASNLMCDSFVSWSGWYRFFIRGVSVNMPDTCVEDQSCGTHAPLWLNGQHPRVEDGVVTLQVCGNWNNDCCYFQTSPIRVKACPGNYYVYELVSPWFCYGAYCADDRSLNIPTVSPGTTLPADLIADPCYSYTVLDEPWRSTSQSFDFMCDSYVNWSGWYRLFINGENAQMPTTCVSEFSCSTAAPLWLKGSHPRVEDGVVRRHVCGHWNNDCCHFEFYPLKVKACPGNYYVYEFVSPTFCFATYCAELSGTQDTMPSVYPHTVSPTPNPDPCSDYHIIDDFWRDITQYQYASYGQDDLLLDWNGWYRLYLNGRSAQMSEWCVTYTTGCGGDTGLYLDGTHPRLEDGVVTRDVLGTYLWYPYQCGNYRSNPIQVKACQGDYYVYKLVKPDPSIPRPTYCTVAFNSISNDPCYDYKSLDRPWRASYESGLTICDEPFSWNGWYRLFHNGMDIRMSENCVNQGSCNTNVGLSLNGPHPEIWDGVVTREVCGDEGNGCCSYKSTPIRVKACPGNYYVYEIAKPRQFCSGYCTDVNTVSQPIAPTPPIAGPLITFNTDYDPCYNYNNLDDYWRSALNNRHVYGQISGNDDTLVEWNGWYRLLLNGQSAQMPEWCATYMSCGGFSSLWLGGSHPQLEDGVVTREVYGTQNYQCSYYASNPIEVKACYGDFYVYKFVKPSQSIPVPVYCAVPFNTPIDDPCYNYNSLDDPWRASNFFDPSSSESCDYNVDWNGWYRLFNYGQDAQMPESCVRESACGSRYPLWLNGPHPQLEDGVVTRQVCSPTWDDCCGYKSIPIQVKACPGNYYVYEFVRPPYCGAYCADRPSLHTTAPVTISPPKSITVPEDFDPCYNYTVLDEPWRATNIRFATITCDAYVSWSGWYRLFIYGQSVRMPETCVADYSCGTHAPLWLNGPHPSVEDGVVTRDVCGNWVGDCCLFHSNPIKVKACPGNYYVYEFVSPNFCYGTYCADVSTINTNYAPTTAPIVTSSSDPCSNYNILDDYWREIHEVQLYYNTFGYDDRFVEWNGWYRLFVKGQSAQMSEWCTIYTGCGGDTGLYLKGSHPGLEDGVVTREVFGAYMWYYQCDSYRSTPIQVKACPGDYYVYNLVKPDMSIPRPTYCTVAFKNTSNDPCYNYESLDRPWRASNESGVYICDEYFSWNGWYRLFHNGMNIRMSENCVTSGCNVYYDLWLNGPHPQIEDGVVTREVCVGSYWGGCCQYTSPPVRVKACPGNYYVYELTEPMHWCAGYCTDVNSISQPSFTTPASITGSMMTLSDSSVDYDPCYNYNIQDDYWRSTLNNWYIYGLIIENDDTRVKWSGWYRLFINGQSAQMPEWCASFMSCGGFSSLWLGGSHPQLEDGVVTREVYGTNSDQCNYFKSNSIQVKACPGDYYVYKLTRPNLSIPAPSYCAVAFPTPRDDPCFSYTSLDEPQRATNYPYYDKYYSPMCDYNVNWNGWYRLFYNGHSAQMPESCVGAGMCNTYYPLYLSDSHPQLEDGVVTRQVCISTWSGCCAYKSHPIQVKACPGNYYVYEFVRPIFCSAYCTDFSNAFITTTNSSISPGPFYPFGTEDTENERSDDGSSPMISLMQPFTFFGQIYNQVYVNNNGYLTFDWVWWYYYPFQFPAHSGRDIIAPFWTDIDNRDNGVISYSQYTSGDVLTVATQDINQYFPDLTFTATWVFVATWDRVAYYSYSGTETSFQVVLISDGQLSFVLMNYGEIAPTQRYVQAGFDTHDSSNHFSISESLTNNITSLTYNSNVNVPGRWAFRTDYGSRSCQFNDVPVQFGNSFWTDATCQQRCTCTFGGLECSWDPCAYSQACRPAAFQYSCQNIERQTCTIAGDPHYYTFDYQIFHFQGTCTYVLSEACGTNLPYYRIEGKNDNRGSTQVSWTRIVRVFVYDEVIELVKDHYYEAKVNGSFAATPFSLRDGSIQVFWSGFSVVISTDFGLLVSYDAYHYVTISVPLEYYNSTCGLCGNFNLNPEDDFRSPDEKILSSDVDFANSWKVESDPDPECHNVRCTGLGCANCNADEMNVYSDIYHCGILGDASGPFAPCHSAISPQIYIENCVYDLCLGGGYQPILCQSLNVYATQCQQQGVQLGQWRRTDFCDIICTLENSHFESQGTGCPATCSNPSAPANCPLPNKESCICNAGYILSAGACVPEANCGCTFEGFYYAEGQSVVLDHDCGRKCVCSDGSMTCIYHQCGPTEACDVHNGVRGCRPTSYATCSVENLGSYHTFDGQTFRYPGACGLTLARVMGPSSLPHFVLTVEKVPRGLEDFSRVLKFEAEGIHVSIEMGEGSNVQVDGQMVGLPISVGSDQIHIYHSSVRGFVLETNFGVTVRADWPHIVKITAPGTYNSTLGGLCGNLNGNIDDEFYSPDGVLLEDPQLFADSWRDGSLSAYCEEPIDQLNWESGHYQNSSQFFDLCHVMMMDDGPFAECSRTLDPSERIQDCIWLLERTGGVGEALCETLRSYTLLCQQNGFAVEEWRSVTNCDPTCPPNSHYELCGTSCPAACPGLSFPFQCSLSCQEGCQCNDGLVLNGDRCVPPMGCGCHYNGRYRQPGEQFWHGEECQSHCVCDGITGNVHCTASACSEQEICQIAEGEYGCHPRPHASCSASGDPHYISFDGTTFDFQGTCRYVLATVCDQSRGLPHFQVEARNEPWQGLPVSITVEVFVNVSGHLVHMSLDQNLYASVEVDGETRNLPVLLDSGRVSVYNTGQFLIVSTDSGFSVTYGSLWVVNIIVPAVYSGATCGICGNFNGHLYDDFMLRSGDLASSAEQFGADWKVEDDLTCNHGCGNNCPLCQDQTTAEALCDIIRTSQGPFSFCHAYVDPQAYFNDCVFDVCISENNNDVLCHSIQSYVSACQYSNAHIYPWRHITTCGMDCSNNSHYELCGTDCGHTCASSIDGSCQHTCSEGCFCDDGFVRSGQLCVPVEQCGCLYNGFYYHIGDQFRDSECSQFCECFAPNDLRCSESSCPSSMECTVRNGLRGCYSQMSTCAVWGDPHYVTFDGALAHFQGTCSYEIANTCGNANDDGLAFRVVATNRHRGNRIVSFVSVVDVWLSQYGVQTHITIDQNRRISVNGQAWESPSLQIDDLVEVHEEQGFMILNALNEFMVHFDGHNTLLIRLSRSFYGALCGMCGNYNGDPADDKVMPDGVTAPDDFTFGHSWISNISSNGCGATDRMGNADGCKFNQEYSELCSIISSTTGPFQQCHLHVDPAPYYSSCVYDLCLSTPANGILCSAVEGYEAACAAMGILISEWRSSVHCPATDPCSELGCTENEWCGEHNDVYGCFCNEDTPRNNPDTFDSFETCESSTGSMSLSRCQLFEAGFPFDNLHLNDLSCRGTVQNGRVDFTFDNSDHICGTSLTANGTHIIYENYITWQPDSPDGLISRKRILKLRFSCTYHQTQTVSLDINPVESVLNRHIQGEGKYQVRMLPYQDAEFSSPFNGNVDVVVDQEIFVEVRVDGVDGNQFASVIDSCWATPVNDPLSSLRWDLIVEECPNPNDDTVRLLQNGLSTSSRFSFRMFIFTANSTKVYLHCNIHLCLMANNDCSAHCYPGHHMRVGRSLAFHDTASISMGPLVLSKRSSDILAPQQVKMSGAPGLCGSLILLLVLCTSFYTIF